MELIDNTTLLELPERIKSLNISPKTPIRVIIEKISEKKTALTPDKEKESKLLFLNDDLWEGKDTPVDLAANHDRYLYDEK